MSLISNFKEAALNLFVKADLTAFHVGRAALYVADFPAGLPTVLHSTMLATANLYSAVFETAGALVGRPRTGGAVLASAAVIAGCVAYEQGYVDIGKGWKDAIKHEFAKRRGDGVLFSEDRALDFSVFEEGNYALNPFLINKYKKSERIRQLVDTIILEAKRNDISPILFANQLFRESAGFDPDVVSGKVLSPAGAIGIAQFMPKVARSLGLTVEDVCNPAIAIPAAAKFMADHKKNYSGDYILALAEYNGGQRSIEFPLKELGSEKISGLDWMNFNLERRETINLTEYTSSAWHNETYKYVAIITSASWNEAFKVNAPDYPPELVAAFTSPITTEKHDRVAANYSDVPIPTWRPQPGLKLSN